jgi:hypothetical protein
MIGFNKSRNIGVVVLADSLYDLNELGLGLLFDLPSVKLDFGHWGLLPLFCPRKNATCSPWLLFRLTEFGIMARDIWFSLGKATGSGQEFGKQHFDPVGPVIDDIVGRQLAFRFDHA